MNMKVHTYPTCMHPNPLTKKREQSCSTHLNSTQSGHEPDRTRKKQSTWLGAPADSSKRGFRFDIDKFCGICFIQEDISRGNRERKKGKTKQNTQKRSYSRKQKAF